MKVGKISETVLKRSIFKQIHTKRDEVLLGAGVGEDCAAVKLAPGEIFVISTDPITGTVKDVGMLAIQITANDLASSGAEPVGVMLTVLLPEEIEEADIRKMMEQVEEACSRFHIQVMGGHTEVTRAVNQPVISVTGVGKVREDRLVSTAGAKPGQDILVTKWIGIEGTSIIAKEKEQELEDLLNANEGELPEEENPIAHVGELQQSPILKLVLPKDAAVSEKQLAEADLLEHREKNTGWGDFSDVAEAGGTITTLLFGEYLLEHFSMFTDEEKTGALDYELEYILEGKASDRENLEAVVKKLMLLRFVPNYAYIQTDAAMKAEAEAMALTLCSLLAVPAITAAAAQVILLAWAYGETVMDLRSLLSGNRVPLIKSKESWQLSLSSLLTLGTEEDQSEGMDTEGGLLYREYLRMLLFLEKQESCAVRALGIIEQNLRQRHGQAGFRADICVSRMEIVSAVTLRRGIRYDFPTYFGYQ